MEGKIDHKAGKSKSTDSASTSSADDKGKKTGPSFKSRGKVTPCGVVFPLRMGELSGAMWETGLTEFSWPELKKMVPKHNVHEKDEFPPPDPSYSKDEEDMQVIATFLRSRRTFWWLDLLVIGTQLRFVLYLRQSS